MEETMLKIQKASLAGFVMASLAMAMLINGCGGSIKVTDSWVDPERESQVVSSVLVLGVAKEETVRRLFEDHFVEELKAHGVNAIVSYHILQGSLTKEMIADALTDASTETILVTRMVDEKTDVVYTPGTTTVYGGYPGYYGSYYSYYNTGYSAVSSPGYVSEWTTYILESNLYDAPSDKLIWTARTALEEPSSVTAAVDALTMVLTRNMQQNGLVRK
jgi:hypothetical protein